MIADVLERTYSVEEYLELEKKSDIKHEYYYGKLIPMAGEKRKANRIVGNIYLAWGDALLQRGFDLYSHDVKAGVDPKHLYRYPDLMVAPLNPDAGDDYIVFDPVLLVEVASEDSWSKDRSKKLKEHTGLPSVLYYMLVFQEEMYVELHRREGDKWSFEIFTEPDDIVSIPGLGVEISLAQIYNYVKLS